MKIEVVDHSKEVQEKSPGWDKAPLEEMAQKINQIALNHMMATFSQVDVRDDEEITELLSDHLRMYGEGTLDWAMQITVSVLGRYRDTAVEEGCLVTLNDQDLRVGRDLIERNRENFLTLVLPTVVYAMEYFRQLILHAPPRSAIIPPGAQLDQYAYGDFIRTTVATALQYRFWTIRQSHIESILGNEDFMRTHQNSFPEIFGNGRILTDDERVS